MLIGEMAKGLYNVDMGLLGLCRVEQIVLMFWVCAGRALCCQYSHSRHNVWKGSTNSFWLIQQKYICSPVPHLNEFCAASQFVQKSRVNEWAEWN